MKPIYLANLSEIDDDCYFIEALSLHGPNYLYDIGTTTRYEAMPLGNEDNATLHIGIYSDSSGQTKWLEKIEF